MIVDPTTVMSYIKNSHVRLLKLDFDLGLVSDVLNAMEKARSSDETWSVGTVLINISSGNLEMFLRVSCWRRIFRFVFEESL